MKPNEWLDRYIAAVKAQLPADKAEDLATELRGLIEDEIEAREAEAGRPLGEPELLELLRRKGHPIRLASAYHERRSLVDEDLFPLFKRSLGLLLLGLLALHLMEAVQGALAAASWNPVRALIGFAWDYAYAALLALGGLCLGFYAFQPQLRRYAGMDDWQPRDLPPLHEGTKIDRTSTSIEFVINLLLLRWLNLDWVDPAAFAELGIAGWQPDLLPWVRLLSAILGLSLLLSLSQLFQPHWTVAKRIADAALSLTGALALGRLIQSRAPFQLMPDAGEWMQNINDGMGAVLSAVVVFLVIDGLYSAYRAYRFRRR